MSKEANPSAGPSAAKKDRKRKQADDQRGSSRQEKGAAAPASFSLFRGGKDELGDVFGKSAVFARPQEPSPFAPTATPAQLVEVPIPIIEAEDVNAVSVVSRAKKSRRDKEKTAKSVEKDETSTMPHAAAVEPLASSSFSKPEGPALPSDYEIDDSDEDASLDLVHESLKPGLGKSKKRASKQKHVPIGETAADRDRRTIFVGNLPIETAKSKHQLKAHLLTFAPSAKVEAIRFRSVPFATPTAALPGDDPEKSTETRVKREKDRAAAWRAQQEAVKAGGQAAEEADKAKTFIDSKGKRKVAFIKKDFHAEMASCNAYVVFAHPAPDRPANVPPILEPQVAASQAVAANGSSFLGRTIRVDSVRLPSSVTLPAAATALAKRDAWLPSGTDPKKSAFVGGLDYAAKEEDVRVFFEELVKKERGEPSEGKWVTGVRIVRDKETQLGKGFGYVHFVDRESVDEVLAMPGAKLKFAKKPLRVQPCKTLPSATSRPAMTTPTSDKSGKAPKIQSVRPEAVPKGNPLLGDKLKDLSKEDRKLAKSADADRQARRLAKKKMRHAMGSQAEKGAVKLTASRAEKERGKRVVKAKKGRVRSERALTKMKGSRG